MTIKKIGLIVMLCLALIGGCKSKDSKTSTISADKIIILYGISSKATKITNEKDILEMTNIYNNSSLEPTDNLINPVTFYTILYYKNDKMIAKLNIDKNSFIQINDDDKVYKLKGTNSEYNTIKKLYNQ